ncbi:hypothetical protein A7985_01125 [Pseudoalteromonas luteoviolacea]|uniref:Uncharacterized protein n=1 Tax=Pseudoalteromonas luteoviolacea TaxID=43657 RepID=A0A1C0TTE0_9GAMM|nr:hypothetical protein A7985_01125 [Pseudoalteromonas luteoviolacea]
MTVLAKQPLYSCRAVPVLKALFKGAGASRRPKKLVELEQRINTGVLNISNNRNANLQCAFSEGHDMQSAGYTQTTSSALKLITNIDK